VPVDHRSLGAHAPLAPPSGKRKGLGKLNLNGIPGLKDCKVSVGHSAEGLAIFPQDNQRLSRQPVLESITPSAGFALEDGRACGAFSVSPVGGRFPIARHAGLVVS
jgi:hypothetical protein